MLARMVGILLARVRRMKPRKKISSRIGARKLTINSMAKAFCLISPRSWKMACSPNPGMGMWNVSFNVTTARAMAM